MKKGKVKKYVLIGAITIVLGILSFFVYQSQAYFKVNYTNNIINTTVGVFGSYEYAYTGTVQEFVAPKDGYYEVELWGASGGDSTGGLIGGKGGYTNGKIYLEKDEKIYIFVGSKGSTTGTIGAVAGPFNGGGSIYHYPDPGCNDYSGTGGGATDIRLINGTWSNSASLRSRIMVAGGGGGSGSRYCNAANFGLDNGGHGGGLVGLSATGTTPFARAWATGGTQTSGGTGGAINGEPGGTSGSFGMGASYTRTTACQASGGGGYYGGGLGIFSGGAGGSSYISGYLGANSVQEIGGTAAQPLHTGNSIHYSGKYFLNNKMESGVNTGNGKAKITYMGETISRNEIYNDIRYVQACQKSAPDSTYSWVELQVVAKGENVARKSGVTVTLSPYYAPYFGVYENLIDGNIASAAYVANYGTRTPDSIEQCLTVDLKQAYDIDDITLWHYYADSRSYYGVSIRTSKNNTTWQNAYDYNVSGRYIETAEGKRVTAWD